MQMYKVAMFYVINGIMDFNECEHVYKHLNARERSKVHNLVSSLFDFIAPLSEFCDLVSFYKGEIQIIICYRNPFPVRAYFFFLFPRYDIVIHYENASPEQIEELSTFMRNSGYGDDFKILNIEDYYVL